MFKLEYPLFGLYIGQSILLLISYCRASHTGDAGRDRGRERERGISSELADMTCCELHLAAELALWRESCRSGKQSDGGQRKGGVEFSFLFLLVLSLSSSLSFLSCLS